MTAFKIAAAQVPSIRGDIAANVQTHLRAMEAAVKHGVSLLIFPELSLIGYEPDIAAKLAITPGDERLIPLAELARQAKLTVAIGAPLRKSGAKPSIGAITLGADGSRQSYAKMHLGGNEPTYFSAGNQPCELTTNDEKIGLAICADTSRPSHPLTYAESGCSIYAAGVFLNADWYPADPPRLSQYAARHRMLVLMANHGASQGTLVSVGKSAVWSPGGELLAEAQGTETALVVAMRMGDSWRGEVLPIRGAPAF